jgi:hypothetical protein
MLFHVRYRAYNLPGLVTLDVVAYDAEAARAFVHNPGVCTVVEVEPFTLEPGEAYYVTTELEG